MNENNSLINIADLFSLAVEGEISDEQFETLKALLKHDKNTRSYYYHLVNLEVLLRDSKGHVEELPIDKAFWQSLAEYEQTAPAIEIPRTQQRELVYDVRQRIHQLRKEQKNVAINKPLLFTTLASLAALLFMIAFVVLNPRIVNEVATVKDAIEAKWGPDNGIRNGLRLAANSKPICLQSGVVKIVSDKNVELVLEGPVKFQFDSVSQVRLFQGRIYAKVSPEGSGFSVDTFNAKIIDLGTEFGVAVDENGNSLVQMYKGKASVISGRSGKTLNTTLLTEGNAGRVNPDADEYIPVRFEQNAFVQILDSRHKLVWRGDKINLADIVGGGNGQGTGKLNYGIGYDGKIIELTATTSASGPKSYIRSQSCSLIDGVFIPNGPTQITSGGATFDFGPTNEIYWLGILNGAWHEVSVTSRVPRHNLHLNGKVYGIPGNSAICMDANQGITFDLDAIRNQYRLSKTIRFTSICGISETYKDYLQGMTGDLHNLPPKASLYVLVDGKPRFENIDITPSSPVGKVDVRIESEDRFLTLVATQGSDGTNIGDWTLFAEPYLYIEP